MFDRLKSFFSPRMDNGSLSAATQLPTPEAPKVKNKQQVLPSYLTTAKPNPSSALALTDRRTANTDITTYRASASTRETIRQFIKGSPDLSAAVASYIRTGITDRYTAVAKNPDGTFNPEGTSAVQQILTRMNILNDYTIGYDDSLSIRSLCEVWAKELMTYGGMAGELVLDKARLPDKIQPVSISQIRLYPSTDGKKLRPRQILSGEEIDLDIATFFMVTLDQDLLTPYAESPIEPALQAVIFSADFMNDIRRIVKKAIHPRVVVTIDEEKFRKSIPPEDAGDAERVAAFMSRVTADVQQKVSGLEPDEAIILFDTFGIEVMDHGNTNLSNEYEVIQGLADSKLSAGAKALPTVLGQSGGTANVASAEVLMFVKYVEGSVWSKLNEMLSKMLTLAVRLLGIDVYVEFSFAPIELRPQSELESFYAMRQSRVLQLLSLGLMSDEEAAVALTGHLPPPGAKPLSGTGFFGAKAADPAGDGYNGASNKGSATNKQREADMPPSGGARGSNKKAEVLPLHGSVQ